MHGNGKAKATVVLVLHEDIWGAVEVQLDHFDLGTRGRWVVSFTPRSFYPKHPLCRRLDGHESQTGCYGVEKTFTLVGAIDCD
jgi:hypothetical protein